METEEIQDTEYDKIKDLENDLEGKKQWLLRRKGWHYSSSYPDSRWRWSKEIGGKVIAVSMDDALMMQQFIDYS